MLAIFQSSAKLPWDAGAGFSDMVQDVSTFLMITHLLTMAPL